MEMYYLYVVPWSEVKWSESRSVMSNSLWPYELDSPRNSPGQNTGVDSFSLLQGIFPTQGSNPVLPHCRQILYQLSHKGSPHGQQVNEEMFNSNNHQGNENQNCNEMSESSVRITSIKEETNYKCWWAYREKAMCLICILLIVHHYQDIRASLLAQLVKNVPAMWETWVWSLGWEDPLEKGTAPHSSILAWRIPWTV